VGPPLILELPTRVKAQSSGAAIFQVALFILECAGILFQVLEYYSASWNNILGPGIIF
jgi:hypothetical protein